MNMHEPLTFFKTLPVSIKATASLIIHMWSKWLRQPIFF